MTFTVKETYLKPGADVLLEQNLGPVEKAYQVLQDPSIISNVFYRSVDRSYAEIYRTWDSAESYQDWFNRTEQLQQEILDEMLPYYSMIGITFEKFFPTQPDQEWPINPELILIEFENIFE